MNECPKCGKRKEGLAQHWNRSKDCDYPTYPNYLKDVVTGLLLGDGTLTRNYKNPVLQLKMVNKNYLNYLSCLFGCFGLGVKKHKTGEEQAEMNRISGFHKEGKGDNYNDVYRWMTRAHPYLNKYRSWYSTGEKVFPEEIEMTPVVLKTWFVCDGDYSPKYSRVRISSTSDNKEKLKTYFEDVQIPKPKSTGNRIYWSLDEARQVHSYMGHPVPGFRYKWPMK